MKQINPFALYESNELKDLLKGVVKIETLRAFGLVGSPGKGYWGSNVIDSLNQYWDNLVRQRDTGKVNGKENHLEEKPAFFENQSSQNQNQTVHTQTRKNESLESERKRFRRKVPKTSFRRSQS